MSTEEVSSPKENTEGVQDPCQHNENSCPSCGSGMKKTQFRTGSVNHPPRDAKVCVSCGTRR